MSKEKPAYTVFIAAEGPSEIGELAREVQWRSDPPREGYLQPMLGKLLGEHVLFDGRIQLSIVRCEPSSRASIASAAAA